MICLVDCVFIHLLYTKLARNFKDEGSSIYFNDSHSAKANFLIEATEFGIEICFIGEHR